jgi:hypothetical protein
MERIYVRATMQEHVSAPIAQQLCSEFMDWLDEQILEGVRRDERSNEELARDYVAWRVANHG